MTGTQTFPPDVAERVEAVLEHFNGRHADTVAFLARHLDGGREARGAELVCPRVDGVEIAVTGGLRLRLPFDQAIGDEREMQQRVLAAIADARAATGDAVALTSLERELATTATIPTQAVQVVSNEPVTDSLRAVRIQGLEGFAPAGPDVFFYALVSTDGEIDPGYTMAEYKEQPAGSPVRGAYYTMRAWDPGTATVTFWVVLHEHDGGVAGWMRNASPGDGLVLWGPRLGYVAPADADRLLLAADETGYAAVARVIEDLPERCRAEAVLEVGDDERPPMPEHPDVAYRWVQRRGAPGTGDELLDAVSRVDLTSGRWSAFGAAESRQVSRIRRLLRQERGLHASQVSMVGYWRRTVQ